MPHQVGIVRTMHDYRFDPARPDGSNPSATEVLAPNGHLQSGQSYVVPARQGRAFRVPADTTFRITNTYGTQVGDFWAFAEDDLGEFLSMEHLRSGLRRVTPRTGDPLLTNRRRPILTFLEDSSPGIHDTMVAACDIYRYAEFGCEGYHDNCVDNLRMALAAINLRVPQIPCPFNLWMNTPFYPDEQMKHLPTVSKPGDHVTFRAELDAVITVSCCPMDMLPINGKNFEIHSLEVLVE